MKKKFSSFEEEREFSVLNPLFLIRSEIKNLSKNIRRFQDFSFPIFFS